MNTVLTDPKKRKLAAILFAIAAGLFIILYFVLNPIRAHRFSVTFWQILYLLCLAAIAVGLFLDKIPFPVAGAGFAGLSALYVYSLITSITSLLRNFFFDTDYRPNVTSTIINVALTTIPGLCFIFAFAVAALIIFFSVYGNERTKQTAKKLTMLPFILLLIYCVYSGLNFILSVVTVFDTHVNYPAVNLVFSLFSLAICILELIGTKKALEAYAYPEGKPKKTVTRADGSVAEAGDGYIGMAKHVLLLLFTFGVWLYIWIWRATQYTNRAPGEEERNPTKKMLLCMFVPFYSIFWTYKTAQRIDAIAKTRGMSSEIATPCLVLAIFVGIVPPILMQDKINAIALNGNAPAAAPAAEPARDVGESTPAAADGVPEELEKYKRLLDNGVITQEEFEAKKKQLLGL